MPELGQFLKEKREFSGLSLKKLSSVTGISDSELLKIENGTRKKPGWEHLCKIAKALIFTHLRFCLMLDIYLKMIYIHHC